MTNGEGEYDARDVMMSREVEECRVISVGEATGDAVATGIEDATVTVGETVH